MEELYVFREFSKDANLCLEKQSQYTEVAKDSSGNVIVYQKISLGEVPEQFIHLDPIAPIPTEGRKEAVAFHLWERAMLA